jgi:phosphoribosylanthranilate isomerase
MVDECRLHMVQLHGDETPKYCDKIADYISVVKAFRVSDSDNIGWRLQEYMDVCDMFMFDTEGAGYGGTGKKFNWDKLKDVEVGKPYFLSGGIEPGDVEKLNEFVVKPEAKGLFAIDINSKFEVTPGIKDLALIKKFTEQLK